MTTSRKLSGGRKKKGNGHKMNCGCPICKNMRKSKKRGGADEDDIMANNIADDVVAAEVADDVAVAEVEDDDLWDADGGRRIRKHKKSSKKRGNGHKMNCGCPICKNMRKSKKHGGTKDDNEDPDEDPDEDEFIDNENADESADFFIEDAVAQDPYEDADEDQNGGKKHRKKSRRKGKKTKRRSSRKSRKSKKSRRHRH